MPITDHTVALDESDIEFDYQEEGRFVLFRNTETGATFRMLIEDVIQASTIILSDHLASIREYNNGAS